MGGSSEASRTPVETADVRLNWQFERYTEPDGEPVLTVWTDFNKDDVDRLRGTAIRELDASRQQPPTEDS